MVGPPSCIALRRQPHIALRLTQPDISPPSSSVPHVRPLRVTAGSLSPCHIDHAKALSIPMALVTSAVRNLPYLGCAQSVFVPEHSKRRARRDTRTAEILIGFDYLGIA